MSELKLVQTLHETIINEENKTLAASIYPCLDQMKAFFELSDDTRHLQDFLDIAKSRIEETLFQEKTVNSHCLWFSGAVRACMVDCNVPVDMVSEPKLRDYAVDVITEILKSQNKNLNK